LEHHLLIASDVGLVDSLKVEVLNDEIEEIRYMTQALRRRALSEIPKP
jgi:hypothetical protein